MNPRDILAGVRPSRGRRVHRSVGWAFGALVLVTGLVACSGSDSTSDGSSSTPATTTPLTPMDANDEALVEKAAAGGCDELDATRCLLPFPSDRFTTDEDTDTGRRVVLPEGQLANTDGTTLDPTDWNRADGFSPGTPILAMFGDVDLDGSAVAPLDRIGRSMDEDSPTVLLDITTGERLPHWVEVDPQAPDGERVLILRPASALPEGHRIGVAIRGLVLGDGSDVVPTPGFLAYRDRLSTNIDSVEARRTDMEELFAALDQESVDRTNLQSAWSFTVASADGLAGRMLHIRDDAFARLGDASPAVQVTEVIDAPGSGETELPPGIGRRVTGTFDVPLYLTGSGEPGSQFDLDAEGLPTGGDTVYSAQFTCQIPQVGLDDAGSTRSVLYGHGLLGSAGEAENTQVAKIASTNNMMYCATDWIGMSASDIGNAVQILGDISKFPSLADRCQQGMLNALFLGRLMVRDDGFAALDEFRDPAGTPVMATGEMYFDGNSQGAIMGGALTAVAQDWDRAVLGVPGMDYALLLGRSVDFEQYFSVLRGAYPDPIDQQIIYAVLQMLWDRAETDGYAQHLTADPYPDTPTHQVILDVAFGDHQVSTWAAEMEARTIGAGVRSPALADGREPAEQPFYGLDEIDEFPTDRSVLIYWDSGTLAPPLTDITPTESDEFATTCDALTADEQDNDAKCADSHEDPRRAPDSIEQKDSFFRPDSKIVDTCDGEPCTAPNRFSLDY